MDKRYRSLYKQVNLDPENKNAVILLANYIERVFGAQTLEQIAQNLESEKSDRFLWHYFIDRAKREEKEIVISDGLVEYILRLFEKIFYLSSSDLLSRNSSKSWYHYGFFRILGIFEEIFPDSFKISLEERSVLSEWIIVDGGHCAARILEGTDPEDLDNRRAFIEKTARVLDPDGWIEVRRGSGSSDPERDETYGFDPKSRAVCDSALKRAGYILRGKDYAEESE